MLRCIANVIINRSCSHFGEIDSFGRARGKWDKAKKFLSGKTGEATNLERGNQRLTEILHACGSFRTVLLEGCFNTKAASPVAEAWNDVRPKSICGRLDRFVERCRTLQKSLQDVLNLRLLSEIEMTGANRRTLSAALSVISRDVSLVLTQFLAKAGGAPSVLLDLENASISSAMDVFSQSVLEFDQRLEEFIRQSVGLSGDLSECLAFVECLSKLAARPSVERSLAGEMSAIAQKFRSEMQSVVALFHGANEVMFDKGRTAGVNMPPVAGAILWAQGLSKRVDAARQAFDQLIDKFGSAGRSAATEVTSLRAESDALSAQLSEWRAQKLKQWSTDLAVSIDDLKQPLLRRKVIADAPISGDQSEHVRLQVVVNLPESVTAFVREIKCALCIIPSTQPLSHSTSNAYTELCLPQICWHPAKMSNFHRH
jgi:hypothetical protein